MAEKEKDIVNKDTTETRIRITEDRHGNFNVESETSIKGSEILIPIRNSHLIGQLFVACIVLLIRSYKKLLTTSNSTVGEKKSGKD